MKLFIAVVLVLCVPVLLSTPQASAQQQGVQIKLGHAHCFMQVITFTFPKKPKKNSRKLTVAAGSWCDHKMDAIDQDLYITKACPCKNMLLDHDWNVEFGENKAQIDAFTYNGYIRKKRNVTYCARFWLKGGTNYSCASVFGV